MKNSFLGFLLSLKILVTSIFLTWALGTSFAQSEESPVLLLKSSASDQPETGIAALRRVADYLVKDHDEASIFLKSLGYEPPEYLRSTEWQKLPVADKIGMAYQAAELQGRGGGDKMLALLIQHLAQQYPDAVGEDPALIGWLGTSPEPFAGFSRVGKIPPPNLPEIPIEIREVITRLSRYVPGNRLGGLHYILTRTFRLQNNVVLRILHGSNSVEQALFHAYEMTDPEYRETYLKALVLETQTSYPIAGEDAVLNQFLEKTISALSTSREPETGPTQNLVDQDPMHQKLPEISMQVRDVISKLSPYVPGNRLGGLHAILTHNFKLTNDVIAGILHSSSSIEEVLLYAYKSASTEHREIYLKTLVRETQANYPNAKEDPVFNQFLEKTNRVLSTLRETETGPTQHLVEQDPVRQKLPEIPMQVREVITQLSPYVPGNRLGGLHAILTHNFKLTNDVIAGILHGSRSIGEVLLHAYKSAPTEHRETYLRTLVLEIQANYPNTKEDPVLNQYLKKTTGQLPVLIEAAPTEIAPDAEHWSINLKDQTIIDTLAKIFEARKASLESLLAN